MSTRLTTCWGRFSRGFASANNGLVRSAGQRVPAGVHGIDAYEPAKVPVRIQGLGILLAISAVTSFAFAWLNLPNAFMLGSLCATIAVTVTGPLYRFLNRRA